MIRSRFLPVSTAILLILTLRAVSQESAAPPAVQSQVRVEITTDKRDYFEGEPIRFKATLTNTGRRGVYIAKTWWYAGGGIAGFEVGVRQVTGVRPKVGCGAAADRAPVSDPRPPEQILREDFVRLGVGESVGLEDRYRGCAVKYAGTYDITATYLAYDFNVGRVSPLSTESNSVLTGTVPSKPFGFRVHAKKMAAKKKSSA
jgi:hypothetical protein